MNKRLVKKCVANWLANENLHNIKLSFADDFQFNGNGSEYDNICITDNYNNDYSMLEKLVKELGYKGNANIITIAFLHELGHHFTCSTFTKEQEQFDNIARKELYKWINSNNESLVDYGLECYYRLPQEIQATKWAIEFATNHPIKTKRLEIALDID